MDSRGEMRVHSKIYKIVCKSNWKKEKEKSKTRQWLEVESSSNESDPDYSDYQLQIQTSLKKTPLQFLVEFQKIKRLIDDLMRSSVYRQLQIQTSLSKTQLKRTTKC